MPPPAAPQQQRRPTRPRPLRRRVFVRSPGTVSNLETGLGAIIASGQAARAMIIKPKPKPAASTSTASSRRPSGAGEEQFAASPLTTPTHSPSPVTTTFTWPKAPFPTERTAVRASTSGARPPPRPVTQPNILVGRFPSPTKGRTHPAAVPPSMPALHSPDSPMETASCSYAAKAATSCAATSARTASKPAPAAAAAAGPAAATVTGPAATAAAAAGTPAANAGPPKAPQRYPPLIVETLPDWPNHFRELKKILGHTPNGRPFGKGVRFLPKSDQEFRHIQRYLTQLESAIGISWFCYSLPADKSLKVAIRGLPVNTEPALIEEELRELGYVPEHVRAIPARPGRPGCLMFAQLQRTANLTPGIYEVTELLCMPGVIIEPWRGKRGPAQCHRCQQFRHSSHNCHRPIACVRCGESHAAWECQRPLTEPPSCANCGGAHTANNATCPAFRKEVRNRRAGTIARTTTARTTASASATEADAPGSLMAAANQPDQKRRRNRGKRSRAQKKPAASKPATTEPAATSKPVVVAAPERRTKATRTAAPQPASKPACAPLDPRITTIVGTLNKVLMAIQEQRDPIPLILGCIAELCTPHG